MTNTHMFMIHIYMKVVGNKRRNTSKLIFLRYSTGESGMIVGSFWCMIDHISKFYFIVMHYHIEVPDHPQHHQWKSRKIQEISRKPILTGNFPEISRIFPDTPPLPPIPPQPTGTSNGLFSKYHFDCIYTFISYNFRSYIYIYIHIYMYMTPIAPSTITVPRLGIITKARESASSSNEVSADTTALILSPCDTPTCTLTRSAPTTRTNKTTAHKCTPNANNITTMSISLATHTTAHHHFLDNNHYIHGYGYSHAHEFYVFFLFHFVLMWIPVGVRSWCTSPKIYTM